VPVDYDHAPAFWISLCSSQRMRNGITEDFKRPQDFIRRRRAAEKDDRARDNTEPEKVRAFSQRLLR
jgi:hypothetical protein